MEIEELKKIINEMPEKEVKSLLFHIFLRVNLLEETEYSEGDFAKGVREMYRTVYRLKNKLSDEEGPLNKVHILFSPSHSGSLKVVLKELGLDKEESVITFWDKFSIGPIWKIQDETGRKARFDWVKKGLNYSLEDFKEYQEGFQKTLDQIESIPEDVPITIWCAENSHEQTGLRFVMHLLKGRKNRIHVINTTKMFVKLFDQPNIRFVPLHTGEIHPEKLKVIYEQDASQPLLQKEKDQYELEWIYLADQSEALRIWKNGRIQSVPEDYFDNLIINKAKKLHKSEEFMKSARVIGEVLGHLEQYVGDEFLEYRLRMLIEKGVFEFEGSLEAMRLYSVKLL